MATRNQTKKNKKTSSQKPLRPKTLLWHVVIGADYAGLATKKYLVPRIEDLGYSIEDVGVDSNRSKMDYPDIARKVGKHISNDKYAKGILICGTGTGMAMAANKIKGVRAAQATDEYSAKMSRKHNDANVLGLPGWRLSKQKALTITKAWLKTPFDEKARHKKKIAKITRMERRP